MDVLGVRGDESRAERHVCGLWLEEGWDGTVELGRVDVAVMESAFFLSWVGMISETGW